MNVGLRISDFVLRRQEFTPFARMVNTVATTKTLKQSDQIVGESKCGPHYNLGFPSAFTIVSQRLVLSHEDSFGRQIRNPQFEIRNSFSAEVLDQHDIALQSVHLHVKKPSAVGRDG